MVWWITIVPAIINVFSALLIRCQKVCVIHFILKMMIPGFLFCREIMSHWQTCRIMTLIALYIIIWNQWIFRFRRWTRIFDAKCCTIDLPGRLWKKWTVSMRRGFIWTARSFCAKASMMEQSWISAYVSWQNTFRTCKVFLSFRLGCQSIGTGFFRWNLLIKKMQRKCWIWSMDGRKRSVRNTASISSMLRMNGIFWQDSHFRLRNNMTVIFSLRMASAWCGCFSMK